MLEIPLMDSTFKDLRDYIYEKSGIYIADTKKYLVENRLARILHEKKMQSFEDYLKLVKFCTNGNELARLFDPFYRVAESRDRQSGGMGIGLTITDRAVRWHGGTVQAFNEPDGGLTIEIDLPVK